MDPSLAINLVSLLISLIALAISAYLAHRQASAAHGANLIPVIFNSFREWRQPDFVQTQKYILASLSIDHDAEMGLSGIPEPLQSQIDKVAIFYDDLGKLVAYRALDWKIVVGTFGVTTVKVWAELRPFIYREREIRGTRHMACFEDLACRAKDNPPVELHKKMGLRSDPGS
ncbi:hypothetical protein ABZZ47_01290 [Streptomyces sp. NPDC006465]|uniref:DUF4760 domain-containing protein n=1 Tax=Streptomyces sp. NPDC006465 TaxID=3157174 RepID=UPI0033B31A56